MKLATTLEQRFWSFVDQRGPDECWLWRGSVAGSGYPHFRFRYAIHQATRLSWSIANGQPFPSDKLACHSCDVPTCVNPRHLWVGTSKDNMHDAMRKGRRSGSGGTCRNGHPRTHESQAVWGGESRCRICAKASDLKRRERERTANLQEA